MNNKNISRVLLFLLISLMVILIAGCRPSSVLEKIIYKQDAEMVDHDNKTKLVHNNQNNNVEDDQIAPQKQVEDADVQRERERDDPVAGENISQRTASKTEYEKNSDFNMDSNQKNASSNDKQTAYPESNAQNDNPSGSVIEGGITSDPSAKKIVDAHGNIISLPEKVERVSAVGEAALIVQMLGGGKSLSASSQSFVTNKFVSTVFSAEEITRVEGIWSGDGSTTISDEAFQRLLASSPDVCFEISGQLTFDDSQISKLNEAGIAYVVLPRFNTLANIKLAVQLVGGVLGDKSSQGGLNAPDLAQKYIRYCDAEIKDAGKRMERFAHNKVDFNNDKYSNGVKYLSDSSDNGKYTVFISEWDNAAHYQVSSGTRITLEGNGAAIARSGYSSSPLSYFMSLAGVVNTAAVYQDFNIEQKWYASPLVPVTRTLSYSGGIGMIQPTKEILTRVDDKCLGSHEFPAIIVADYKIREKLLSDPMWKNYGKVTTQSYITTDYGFLDEDGNIVKTTVVGDYDILVNPQGAGSWSNGSVESILEPIWIAWKFGGAYTETEVKEKVTEFYRTFYRYELTQAECDDILALK